ncbi:MAG: hypothetical protein COW48_02625 [Hydrogenophilales bacterium CG17_big_fil_post_rev_8_21_14_2_50_63_12]|nr:MAG: hypothetical protein COW48_02625 [Hydrogenophilales bacterium CG17_big_fil_post_rev_8_21_14_2_50_63_12]
MHHDIAVSLGTKPDPGAKKEMAAANADIEIPWRHDVDGITGCWIVMIVMKARVEHPVIGTIGPIVTPVALLGPLALVVIPVRMGLSNRAQGDQRG